MFQVHKLVGALLHELALLIVRKKLSRQVGNGIINLGQ